MLKISGFRRIYRPMGTLPPSVLLPYRDGRSSVMKNFADADTAPGTVWFLPVFQAIAVDPEIFSGVGFNTVGAISISYRWPYRGHLLVFAFWPHASRRLCTVIQRWPRTRGLRVLAYGIGTHFETRWLSKSAANTVPSLDTATARACWNCPGPLPFSPNPVRNVPSAANF